MFSLNMSHPPRMVTQHRPGFLAARPKSYASRADELHSRIHNNGRSIAQNSAIKPSEQLSNKRKRDADNNSGEGNSQEKDGTTSNGKENDGHGGENDS